MTLPSCPGSALNSKYDLGQVTKGSVPISKNEILYFIFHTARINIRYGE